MKFSVMMMVIFMVAFAGCASGPVLVSTELSGPPAVLAAAWENRKMGYMGTSPGGFIKVNPNPFLGAIINADEEEEKDVWIFRYSGNEWKPYRGACKVLTPKGWMELDGLEAVHFETASIQRVTLRLNDGRVAREIRFSTYGREEDGDYYRRVNALLIALPLGDYQFKVIPHRGKSIFKYASGYPYAHYLYLSQDNDPMGAIFGNQWIGWKIYL